MKMSKPKEMDAKDIEVSELFQSRLRPLTRQERFQLETSILEEGCRNPLIIWERDGKNILVDGHSRFRICTEHKIPFRVQMAAFEDEAEVFLWMRREHKGRRHHFPKEERYYRGREYHERKHAHGTNQHSRTGKDYQSSKGDWVCQQMAQEAGVTEKTIRNDEKFALMIDAVEGHVGLAIRWGILTEQLPWSKKLYEALMATKGKDAAKIILAVKDLAKAQGKSKPSIKAILKALGVLDIDPPEELPPSFKAERHIQALIDLASAGDQSDVLAILQSLRQATTSIEERFKEKK